MKICILVAALMIASPSFAAGENLINFLKTCGWGTVIGAGAGAVSLAFTDKPSDHTGDIARGASLGLYGGIAYGLIDLNQPTQKSNRVDDLVGWISPDFDRGQLQGASAHVVIRGF